MGNIGSVTFQDNKNVGIYVGLNQVNDSNRWNT